MGRWLALVLATVALPTAAQAQPPLERGTIQVHVVGIRNDQGLVGCSLFDSPQGFPGERRRAVRGDLVRIRNGDAVCTFEDVPPGTYAVSVLHDEDRDGSLDTGLFGVPTEGYGASNDASSTFGPPEWSDARFRYDGAGERLRIRMRY